MKFIRLKAIVRKEVYHLIRDYRSLYLAFAIPLLLIMLFGYALSLDVDHVPTVFVDYDQSALSRDLMRKLEASSYFNVMGSRQRSQEAIDDLDHDRAKVAIVIPRGFMKNITADREVQLQVLIDASDPTFGNIIRGYITSFVERYNQTLLKSFLSRQWREEFQPPVEGRIRIWFNEDLESRNFIIPGIVAIIIMIVGALLTSLVIAREYENGTMETIKSLPVSAGEFLLGKAIPYFFIGLTDVLVAVLLGRVLFGIVIKGNFWLMMVASSLYLGIALSLGLLISIKTKSQMLANQIAIMTTYLPSLLLSDFVFPIINMPQVIQSITVIVPAKYFIDILSGIYLRNLGLDYLWPSLSVLFGMFVLLSLWNYRLLKREGL